MLWNRRAVMQTVVAIWIPLWPIVGVILAPAPTMVVRIFDAQTGPAHGCARSRKPIYRIRLKSHGRWSCSRFLYIYNYMKSYEVTSGIEKHQGCGIGIGSVVVLPSPRRLRQWSRWGAVADYSQNISFTKSLSPISYSTSSYTYLYDEFHFIISRVFAYCTDRVKRYFYRNAR